MPVYKGGCRGNAAAGETKQRKKKLAEDMTLTINGNGEPHNIPHGNPSSRTKHVGLMKPLC